MVGLANVDSPSLSRSIGQHFAVGERTQARARALLLRQQAMRLRHGADAPLEGFDEGIQRTAAVRGLHEQRLTGGEDVLYPVIELGIQKPQIGRASCRERVCQYV